MKLRITSAALAVAMASSAVLTTTVSAEASERRAGTTSLAEVLAADGNRFDKNGKDFDVLDRAVRVVLKEKPESPVGVLADGDTRLTAFIPTDSAFAKLVKDLTGTAPESEKEAFNTLASLAGVDTVETVLLYHVVPGDTIKSGEAKKADGVKLTTAQGGKIKVNVTKDGIFLKDADKDDADPKLLGKLLDINKGNKQIAHGINRVLRPIDL